MNHEKSVCIRGSVLEKGRVWKVNLTWNPRLLLLTPDNPLFNFLNALAIQDKLPQTE